MSENMNNELNAAVDDLMGGEAVKPDHSPEDAKDTADQSLEAKTAPEDDVFDPYGGDEYGFFADSVEKEKEEAEDKKAPESAPEEKADSAPEAKEAVPNPEIVALQEEIANYKKRLHDTQKAMHEANASRAELQKQLDSLKQEDKKDGDDEDWFNESDSKSVEKFEKELAEVKRQSDDLKNQQERYQQELQQQKWMKEAEALAKEHEDFETLVYEKLEPLMDEETGDPMIRALYMQQEDKSPAGAYAFAKKLFGLKAQLSGEVPKEENAKEAEASKDPARGKAGLDRINSADFPEEKRRSKNMIDEVFG